MFLFGFVGELYLITKNQIISTFIPRPPAAWCTGHKGDVILVTGWLENWYAMRKIGHFFHKKGYRIHVPNQHKGTVSLSQSVDLVKAYIFEQGLNNIIFIAHSKGGVVVKKLMHSELIASRTKKVFTISTPYHGSIFAAISFGHIYELKPNSNCLKKIHRRHDDNSRIYNLYPSFDTHVIPNRNLFLEGATNKLINITGHTRILESMDTIKYIDREMRKTN